MSNLTSHIANKYLKFKHKDRNISLMIKICFLGISIGTFALMLTLIITNGFEKTIHEKMQGINSQVIVYSPGNKLDYDKVKTIFLEEFSNEISAISASSIRQVLIDKNKNQSVLFVKGIDAQSESFVTNIAEKITFPLPLAKTENYYKDFLINMLTENKIIIGYKTAQSYNLKIGDQITLLIPEPGSKNKIFLNKQKVIVSGIFKVGLEEYDNNFAFCSLPFLQNLFNEKKGVDQLNLKLNDKKDLVTLFDIKESIKNLFRKTDQSKTDIVFNLLNQTKNYFFQIFKNIFYPQDKEKLIIEKLKKRFPMLSINSWKDLYPALVSSLKLEKYVMFFIIALITLVACMTMISLLFMYIQQKRRDIAIFKSMGLSDKKIRAIFLIIGLKITFWASISGLTLAAIAGYFLENYPFIELPDVYYISYLPARIEPELFVVVFAATILLGFLATWIPAQRTKKINIAQVLRE